MTVDAEPRTPSKELIPPIIFKISPDKARLYKRINRYMLEVVTELSLSEKVLVQSKKLLFQSWKEILRRDIYVPYALACIYLAARLVKEFLPLKRLEIVLKQASDHFTIKHIINSMKDIEHIAGIKTVPPKPEDFLLFIFQQLEKDPVTEKQISTSIFSTTEYLEYLHDYASQLIDLFRSNWWAGMSPYNIAILCVGTADYLIGRQFERKRGYIFRKNIVRACSGNILTYYENYSRSMKLFLESDEFSKNFQWTNFFVL